MKSSVKEDGREIGSNGSTRARNEEYGELLEMREDFFKEIAHENFTFSEIEETMACEIRGILLERL